MEWSNENTPFNKVIRYLSAPCYVKIFKDVESESNLETFSAGDILSIQKMGFMTLAVAQTLDVETLALSDEFFIPLTDDGFVKTFNLHGTKEFRILREILQYPPRFVSVKKNFKSPTGEQFCCGTAFEIIRISSMKTGTHKEVLVKYKGKEIVLPEFTVGSFTPLDDQTTYLLKDIVSYKVISKYVTPVEDTLKRYTSLSENEVLQINRQEQKEVATGWNTSRKRTFVLPLDSNIEICQQNKDIKGRTNPPPPRPPRTHLSSNNTTKPDNSPEHIAKDQSVGYQKEPDRVKTRLLSPTDRPRLPTPIQEGMVRPRLPLPIQEDIWSRGKRSCAHTNILPPTDDYYVEPNRPERNFKPGADTSIADKKLHTRTSAPGNLAYDYPDVTKIGVLPSKQVLNKPVGCVPAVRRTVSDTSQDSDNMESLSVGQLCRDLSKCGLHSMAEVCQKEKLDGEFICGLSDGTLSESPFNLRSLDLIKFRRMKTGWRPNID